MIKVIKMKKESPTIQIGLRIEKDLLKSIEFIAEANKVDKMSIIRQAITLYVDDMETDIEDGAIEDYIAGRIDEVELKRDTGMKEVPEDLKSTRNETLKLISKKRMKRD